VGGGVFFESAAHKVGHGESDVPTVIFERGVQVGRQGGGHLDTLGNLGGFGRLDSVGGGGRFSGNILGGFNGSHVADSFSFQFARRFRVE